MCSFSESPREATFLLFLLDVHYSLSTSNPDLSEPSSQDESNSYFFKEALPRAVGNIEVLVKTFRRLRDLEYKQGCEVVFTFLEALTKDCRDVSLDYKLSGPSYLVFRTLSPLLPTFSRISPPSSTGRRDIKVPKTSCSVFQSTNLNYVLRNLHVEQLIITGQLTDQCVESAVRDAADMGFFVTVVDDACAAMSVNSQVRGLMGMSGFCRIISTAEILDELSKGYSMDDIPKT
jgi:ureidoacrylate peracid hydrolase